MQTALAYQGCGRVHKADTIIRVCGKRLRSHVQQLLVLLCQSVHAHYTTPESGARGCQVQLRLGQCCSVFYPFMSPLMKVTRVLGRIHSSHLRQPPSVTI